MARTDRSPAPRSDPGPRRRRRREHPVEGYARLDRDRPERIGLPEVVLAEGKSVEHLVGIVRSLAEEGAGAIISRPTAAQREALRTLPLLAPRLHPSAHGRVLRLSGPLGVGPRRGTVALLAAGTSDVPCAEEARALLQELGLSVVTAYDVGVAGLHRLLRSLRRLARHRPRVYLVFAGREGALPTVVSGLVPAPVIGVPTSVGYGRGGRGEAALNAMLQSCAPLAVVNIDAAVPAALFASQLFLPRTPRRARRGRRR